MRWRTALVLGLLVGTIACGDPEEATEPAAPPEDQRYEASLTVLESPDHGPELCYGVADSLPPQCGGLPIDGWDWSAVEAESASGTTWGDYHVVGTFDGERFTLTEPPGAPRPSEPDAHDFSPGCDDPEIVDPSHGQAELDDALSQSDGGIPGQIGTWISRPDSGGDGRFVATVVVTTGHRDDAETYVRQRYGGPLCLVERDITQADIDRVQRELHDEGSAARVRAMASSYDLVSGRLRADVWVADEEAIAAAEERWGDLVELRGILQPVT
jgi:hypothetical protein